MSQYTPENNTLSIGMEETKAVLTFVIALATAVNKSEADGKLDLMDVANFIPVVMTIGPALAGLKEMQVELKAVTPVEAADLKAWVVTQVPNAVSDAHVDQFIQGAFAVVLDLWMVIRDFFLLKTVPTNEGGAIASNPVDLPQANEGTIGTEPIPAASV